MALALTQFITGEKLQMLCDVYIGLRASIANPKIEREKYIQVSELPQVWDNPKRIFCYSDTLNEFMSKLHSLQNPFLLVSHNGDTNISNTFMPILEHPLLIAWYAQNVMITHPKLHMLPIGIANEMWDHGNLATLQRVRRSMYPKEDKIYFYFNVETNRAERIPCKQTVGGKGIPFGEPQAYADYLETLAKCKFAICPPGNGIDSHRIWECYYLGVIPIVLQSPFTDILSRCGLPCIALSSWDEFADASTYMVKYKNLSAFDCRYIDFRFYKFHILFDTTTKKKSQIFDYLLKLDETNYMEHIISPVTPYFLCHHYMSTELHRTGKYVGVDIEPRANNLLINCNYSDINDYDIIHVQIDLFNHFVDNVLPIIEKLDKKIILITSQLWLPQIHKSPRTEICLQHKNIVLWLCQNPIYPNSAKYIAFPYGIQPCDVNRYMQFVKTNPSVQKDRVIRNLQSTVHGHLPADHIRRVYEIFGTKSGDRMSYEDYLSHIAKSQFLISTAGDRDDAHRHYECIGLGTIPVSNISYKSIFEEHMVYSSPLDMIAMVENNSVNQEYTPPNKDLITVQYWKNKINAHLQMLLL